MLENHGFLQKGLSVTVIPSANPFFHEHRQTLLDHG